MTVSVILNLLCVRILKEDVKNFDHRSDVLKECLSQDPLAHDKLIVMAYLIVAP